MDQLLLFKGPAQVMKAESIICYHHSCHSLLLFGKKKEGRNHLLTHLWLLLVAVYHLLCYAGINCSTGSQGSFCLCVPSRLPPALNLPRLSILQLNCLLAHGTVWVAEPCQALSFLLCNTSAACGLEAR